MFKRMLALLLLLAGFMPSAAQSPLDAYKYIIVPKRFGFLSEENKYRVNSTTKYLFEKNGFKTLIQGERYPEDLIRNPCLGVTTDIVDDSSVFMTKLYVVLLDCQGQEVYRSTMGKSKEKSYDKTYIYALNDAFTSFEEMSYAFDPSLTQEKTVVTPVPVVEPAAEPAAEPVVEAAAAEPAADPVVEPAAAVPAAAVPVAVIAADPAPEKETPAKVKATETQEETREESPVSVASSYGNENVSFLLISQGDKLVAYISDSKNSAYKKGEVIGTLVKTSLPNVFRASWKNMDKDIDQTTAYFDDQGNLKIDVEKDGKIEVLTFVKE